MGRLLLAIGLVLLVAFPAAATDERSPSVGMPGFVEQVLLPGTELEVKPMTDRSLPIVMSIVNAFPHGDSFRYDFKFQGLEPGKFNLVDYLQRKDGSAVLELPKVPVQIRSLLPPGQVEPNSLASVPAAKMGGYSTTMIALAVVWCLVFFGLIFLGRPKPAPAVEVSEGRTFVDLLSERLQSARDNQLQPQQYAELERMIFAYWRKRLRLEDVPVKEAMQQVSEHAQAGPLVAQVERWLHSPKRDAETDLVELLKPYDDMDLQISEVPA